MVIPAGVDIPMPRPYGGTVPTIIREPNTGDNAKGSKITVQFVGEIGPVTQYLELINVLDTATEDDHVVFQIDSPGGDVYTAQLLVDRMESCKAKVTTVASGLVASAATFIWFYGQEKEVGRWARFMFHSSLHGDWGKSLAIKENATELVNYMKSILTDQQKDGVLLGLELAKILKDKANVELSGATVQARLKAAKAEGEEEPANPEEGDTGTDAGEEGSEGEEGAAAPEAKKGKKKAKKRRAEGEEGAGEEAGAGDDEGAEGGEDEGAEGGESEGGLDIEAIFAENGIEGEPVSTPVQPAEGGEETTSEEAEEGEPGAPEAKCGKKSKKGKKRRCEGEEGEGEEEITPDGGDEGGESDDGAEGDEEGAEEAPAAKCGKKGGKKISKKRRAENASSDVEVGEEPESAKPEQGSEIVPGSEGDGGSEEAGATDEESNAGKSAAFDIASIFAEEGVEEAPAEEEGDDEGAEEGEGEEEGDEDEGGEEEEAGEEAPSAKCGKGKKKAKPSKKRRGEGDPVKVDPNTTEINTEDKPTEVEIQKEAPASRYW